MISSSDQLQLPNISETVDVLDFSGNRFTELPLLWESRLCRVHDDQGRVCHVGDNGTHCRVKVSFRG